MSILKPYPQLSEEQKELIIFCTDTKEHIFLEGPPWSGKALTCLYSMRNVVEANGDCSLFMVSNNAMYGYISTALKELEVREQAKIENKDKFFWKMAGDFRISIDVNSDYRDNYDSILTNLLDEEIEKKYCLTVVSEVQDYLEKEWELIKRMSERIVCYGDFRQALYDNKVVRETIISDCIHRELDYDYKGLVSNKLMRVRDYFFNDSVDGKAKKDCCEMEPLANDVKYSAVDINYGDELKAIAERRKALEGEDSRVAIICPNNNRFAELSYYLKIKGVKHNYYEINGDLRNHDFNSTTPLFISIFNAEGLQFDNVILFGFDESNYIIEMKRKEDRLKIILYVGMTRARNTTYIIRSEDTVTELKEFNCLDH